MRLREEVLPLDRLYVPNRIEARIQVAAELREVKGVQMLPFTASPLVGWQKRISFRWIEAVFPQIEDKGVGALGCEFVSNLD